MRTSITIVFSFTGMMLLLCYVGCTDDNQRESETLDASTRLVEGRDLAKLARQKRERPDPEEQRRRTEALRRAAEELAIRGVRTDGYLMNLIADEDSYRVAFVKQVGTTLQSRITVRVRREDFEVLSVEGTDLPNKNP